MLASPPEARNRRDEQLQAGKPRWAGIARKLPEHAQRNRQIWHLRKSTARSFEDIGREFGISESWARSIFEREDRRVVARAARQETSKTSG
ncbi:hypothetical protein [Novosphingobium sp. JCM 18896]|uniref:hypothetical protein n=1 Tax=Novosphingobium sp. JCM 18896 TaxID=2989731 RepID=UPI0022233B95|nr:hypothetical protein [Novosphingobium sp. JCM 18896]